MATSSTLTEERLDPTYITIAESRPNLVALVEKSAMSAVRGPGLLSRHGPVDSKPQMKPSRLQA